MILTDDQLQELIQAIRMFQAEKHFIHCNKRFRGERSAKTVKAFLDYKLTIGISDGNALQRLALLLERPSHNWWFGVKDSVTT